MIQEIIKLEYEEEALKLRMNSDKSYIKLLHDYNDLKV